MAGAVGIARTLLYAGEMGESLYSVDADGDVSDGTGDEVDSFFCEYKHKLEKIYSGFLTKRGKEIALERQQAAVSFYENILHEVRDSRQLGKRLLRERLESEGGQLEQ